MPKFEISYTEECVENFFRLSPAKRKAVARSNKKNMITFLAYAVDLKYGRQNQNSVGVILQIVNELNFPDPDEIKPKKPRKNQIITYNELDDYGVAKVDPKDTTKFITHEGTNPYMPSNGEAAKEAIRNTFPKMGQRELTGLFYMFVVSSGAKNGAFINSPKSVVTFEYTPKDLERFYYALNKHPIGRNNLDSAKWWAEVCARARSYIMDKGILPISILDNGANEIKTPGKRVDNVVLDEESYDLLLESILVRNATQMIKEASDKVMERILEKENGEEDLDYNARKENILSSYRTEREASMGETEKGSLNRKKAVEGMKVSDADYYAIDNEFLGAADEINNSYLDMFSMPEERLDNVLDSDKEAVSPQNEHFKKRTAALVRMNRLDDAVKPADRRYAFELTKDRKDRILKTKELEDRILASDKNFEEASKDGVKVFDNVGKILHEVKPPTLESEDDKENEKKELHEDEAPQLDLKVSDENKELWLPKQSDLYEMIEQLNTSKFLFSDSNEYSLLKEAANNLYNMLGDYLKEDNGYTQEEDRTRVFNACRDVKEAAERYIGKIQRQGGGRKTKAGRARIAAAIALQTYTLGQMQNYPDSKMSFREFEEKQLEARAEAQRRKEEQARIEELNRENNEIFLRKQEQDNILHSPMQTQQMHKQEFLNEE